MKHALVPKVLNQAVKRNSDRFPKDFMFRLNDKEKKQLVTNCDRFKILARSNSLPFVFTEQGVAQRLNELEYQFMSYAKDNNQQIEDIFKHLNYLIEIHQNPKIGFKIDE